MSASVVLSALKVALSPIRSGFILSFIPFTFPSISACFRQLLKSFLRNFASDKFSRLVKKCCIFNIPYQACRSAKQKIGGIFYLSQFFHLFGSQTLNAGFYTLHFEFL